MLRFNIKSCLLLVFSTTGATVKCSACHIQKTLVTELPNSPKNVRIVKSIKETPFSMTKI